MKINYIVVMLLLITPLLFFACSRKKSVNYVEGGLYASPREKGGYNIIKILKKEKDGYHVRTYSNVYSKVPKSINPDDLFMVGMDKGNETQDPGMGHLPIGKQSFETWSLTFIQKVNVEQKELEGYDMWKEANGGYF